MYRKDKRDGLSKQGAGRVGTFKLNPSPCLTLALAPALTVTVTLTLTLVLALTLALILTLTPHPHPHPHSNQVGTFKLSAEQLVYCYTLECNYNMSKLLNLLPEKV